MDNEPMTTRRDVAVLGSTGSIGTQALDIVRANPDRFRVVGADRGREPSGTCSTRRWRSSRRRSAGSGRRRRPRRPRGPPTSCSTASPARSGSRPTLAALDAGNTLALANKESLIMGGPLVLERAKPGPDRAGRLRALARWPSACAAARAEEVRRLVLTASAAGRSAAAPASELARGHARGGARPPDLGHGPGRDDQLRHPGQQGSRGDRGTPALRHPLRPDRGRGPPDLGGALDGGVRRRLDAGAGQPADDADPDRARPGLARPGARHRAAGRLDADQHLGVLPARRRGVPGRAPGPRGGGARRHGARGLQRRQRGLRRGVPQRSAAASSRSSTRWPACSGPRRTLGADIDRRRRPGSRRLGPRRGHPR